MAKSIVLIGMMGCGKTTVGKLLAQHFGCTLVDTDAMIERTARFPTFLPQTARRISAPWNWSCAGSWAGGRIWSLPAAAVCPCRTRPFPR